MKAFFNLIRWQNLLIVILTMVMIRYAVIAPILSKISVVLLNSSGDPISMSLQSPWYDFILLVAATVFLTAGGYVINDYFDIKTDLINKGKVIVGTKIPRRHAMMWHNILNVMGVAIGVYVSKRVGYIEMGAMFLVVSGLLYFYSASYKRQFLIGNIIVALLTAMVPMMVILYEWPVVYKYYAVHAVSPPSIDFLFYWVGGFALFAFLTTLTREIIKDIEDFEGDVTYGRKTLPVVIGVLSSKITSVCLIIITVIIIYLTWYFYINDTVTLVYLSVMVVVPLILVIYTVVSGKTRNDLHKASNLMKLVMLTGIMYSFVVKIILTWNLF